MWHEKIPKSHGWSSLWHRNTICSCGAIRTNDVCLLCNRTFGGVIEESVDAKGRVFFSETSMGAEGRYEDHVYLDLIQREWTRPEITHPNSPGLSGVYEKSAVVLLFWTYFEGKIERLVKLGLQSIAKPMQDDILSRYGSISARMDRLYKLNFGVTYFQDLEDVGDAWCVKFIRELQRKRNEFTHGNPFSINKDLASEVVTRIEDEHAAWIKVFNRRIAFSSLSLNH